MFIMTVFFIIVICVIIEVYKAFKETMKPKIECNITNRWDEKPWDDAMREKYGAEFYDNLKKKWKDNY